MPTTYNSGIGMATTSATTTTDSTGDIWLTSGTTTTNATFTGTVTIDSTTAWGTSNGFGDEWVSIVASPVENEALRERRAKARKKAMRLLRTFLTRKQKYNLTRFGRFDFVGADKRVYRLTSKSQVGNIYVLKDGKPVERYCAHPRNVPIGDVLLTQFFALKTNSKKVLEVANEFTL